MDENHMASSARSNAEADQRAKNPWLPVSLAAGLWLVGCGAAPAPWLGPIHDMQALGQVTLEGPDCRQPAACERMVLDASDAANAAKALLTLAALHAEKGRAQEQKLALAEAFARSGPTAMVEFADFFIDGTGDHHDAAAVSDRWRGEAVLRYQPAKDAGLFDAHVASSFPTDAYERADLLRRIYFDLPGAVGPDSIADRRYLLGNWGALAELCGKWAVEQRSVALRANLGRYAAPVRAEATNRVAQGVSQVGRTVADTASALMNDIRGGQGSISGTAQHLSNAYTGSVEAVRGALATATADGAVDGERLYKGAFKMDCSSLPAQRWIHALNRHVSQQIARAVPASPQGGS